jgi:adenine-specific DNA-methyltransferase
MSNQTGTRSFESQYWFVAFIEKGFMLLNDGGVTTMIVSDAYCHSKYAQKSQNWFLKNARIVRLDFCSELKIFDAAVHNLIYLFERIEGTHSIPERRAHLENFGNICMLPSNEQAKMTYRVFFPQVDQHGGFSCPTLPIGNICYLSYGLAASSDEKLHKGEFITDDVTQDVRDKKHPKPWVEGKLLAKWLPTGNRWLEWGTTRAPSHFRRLTFEELFDVSEKLLIMRVAGNDLRSCYDAQQLYTNHTSIIAVSWHALAGVRNNSLRKAARYRGEKPPKPDLPKREELECTSRRFAVKYLLGVMNSAAARDFLRANRRSNTDLYPDDWKKLPIPDVSSKQQSPVVELVDKILVARRADPGADIAALESEIDALVASLYGITSGGDVTTLSHGAKRHSKTLVVKP